MKKTILFCLTVLGTATLSTAQNYTVTPANTVTVTAPYNEISIFDIYQNNTASNKIQLKWELVSNGLVAGWDFSLCELGNCLAGLPANGTMDSVPVGGQGFLGLNVNPYAIAGTGIVKIYVYENGFYSSGDTLTWIVNSAPSGINELTNTTQFSVFPNPATDVVKIKMDRSVGMQQNYFVFNVLGKLVFAGVLTPSEAAEVNTSSLSKGIYFVQLSDENNKKTIAKKLIISK